uniref:Bm12911, isoform a n=1 Tax=Brugia malayi TaxID=6279 RepID=A0A1I9G6D3_BRUMA|nr:Bm12911, isoform a [Brugia malayi]
MDDDIIDLLVVSGVAAVGFITLAYLVTKIYSDKIKRSLLRFKKKMKHFIAIPNVAVVQSPKSVLTFQKFNGAGRMHTENSRKILTHSVEPLKKQLIKRVRIEVEECKEKLDSRSSFNSPNIESKRSGIDASHYRVDPCKKVQFENNWGCGVLRRSVMGLKLHLETSLASTLLSFV